MRKLVYTLIIIISSVWCLIFLIKAILAFTSPLDNNFEKNIWHVNGHYAINGNPVSYYLDPSFRIILDYKDKYNKLPEDTEFNQLAELYFGLDYRWQEHAAPIIIQYINRKSIDNKNEFYFEINICSSEKDMIRLPSGGTRTTYNYQNYKSCDFIDCSTGIVKQSNLTNFKYENYLVKNLYRGVFSILIGLIPIFIIVYFKKRKKHADNST